MKFFYLIFILFISICCNAQQNKDSIYTKVDIYPCFVGCNMYKDGSLERINCSNEKVLSYIKAHLVYPEKDIESANEGTVYVQFVINEEGDVKEVKALNKIGIELEKEAVLVIKNMPIWIAGTIHNNPVKVKMTIPIQFKLDPSQSNGYVLSWAEIKGKNIINTQLKRVAKELPILRDKQGNEVNFMELVVERFENDAVWRQASRGTLSVQQTKLIKKCKVGNTLRITVTVPQKGDFIYIDKTYNIIK
jgi:TonB family protein